MDNLIDVIAVIGLLIPMCIGFWYEIIHIVFLGKPSRFDIEMDKLFSRKDKNE